MGRTSFFFFNMAKSDQPTNKKSYTSLSIDVKSLKQKKKKRKHNVVKVTKNPLDVSRKTLNLALELLRNQNLNSQLNIESSKVYLDFFLLKHCGLYEDLAKPYYIPLPESPNNFDDKEFCLIVKDDNFKDIKDFLDHNPVEGLERVISHGQLYREFPDRKSLEDLAIRYDFFIIDAFVTNTFGNFLGKTFRKYKKQPLRFDLSATDHKRMVEKIIAAMEKIKNSVIYRFPKKDQLTIFCGDITTQSNDKIIDNIFEIMVNLKNQIESRENNKLIKVHLKKTMSIPVWHNDEFVLTKKQ